ncbi:DUF4123 domain-containing protein [Providencia stuartii]|uniref:DUF4123 domain-containing protein n=1 Tax=Providencia stuartii TaxID=588 RepID=UPI001B6BA40B|nr:DUF4123 domain-containing protein [Providencia stuartii]MBQ0695267.1 DUF4123 domain-containing protein [Providencia stuartii]
MMNVDLILNRLTKYPDAKLYCLVCGLQYERVYGDEIKFIRHVTSPLFRQFPDTQIAWAGPWLFNVTEKNEFIERFAKLEVSAPALSWIISSTEIDNLAVHLASLMNITLPDNRTALFRFYDPRVMKNIPNLLDDAQCQFAMKPIHEWYYRHDNQYYTFQGGMLI